MPVLQSFYIAYCEAIDIHVVGQTTEGNSLLISNHQLSVPVLDDSALQVSFAYDLDVVPTTIVSDVAGNVTLRDEGFVKADWQALNHQLASISGLPTADINWDDLPDWRPGCGSLSVDPVVSERQYNISLISHCSKFNPLIPRVLYCKIPNPITLLVRTVILTNPTC